MTVLYTILLASICTMVSYGMSARLPHTTSRETAPLNLTVTIEFSENEAQLPRLFELVARLVMEKNVKANATSPNNQTHPIEELVGSATASFVNGRTEASETHDAEDEEPTVPSSEVSSSRHQRDVTGNAGPTSALATAGTAGQSVEDTCWISQEQIQNVIGMAWSLKHATDDIFKTSCEKVNATLTRDHNVCLSDHEVHHLLEKEEIVPGHNTSCPPRDWMRNMSRCLGVLGKRASRLATRAIHLLQEDCDDICSVSCHRQPLADMTCRFDTVLASKVDNIASYVNRMLRARPSPPHAAETDALSDRPSDVVFLRLLKYMLSSDNTLIHGLETGIQYYPNLS